MAYKAALLRAAVTGDFGNRISYGLTLHFDIRSDPDRRLGLWRTLSIQVGR